MLVYIYIYVHFFCMRHDSWTHIHSQVCNILHTCIQYISMCIYIYIHIYVYVFVYVHIYIHTHIYIYLYMYITDGNTQQGTTAKALPKSRAAHTILSVAWSGGEKKKRNKIYILIQTHAQHTRRYLCLIWRKITHKKEEKQTKYVYSKSRTLHTMLSVYSAGTCICVHESCRIQKKIYPWQCSYKFVYTT